MVTHAKFWRWLVTLLAGIMVVQVVVTSMTSAQVAGAEGDRDLSTLIDDHTILDSVKVSFKDANDQPVPDDQVTNASTWIIHRISKKQRNPTIHTGLRCFGVSPIGCAYVLRLSRQKPSRKRGFTPSQL